MAQEQGSDELEGQEVEAPPADEGSVGAPSNLDAETAELLRTLEMSASVSSEVSGVPLAGVLRRPPRKVDEDTSGLEVGTDELTTDPYLGEGTLGVPEATIPDVIAYEPINVDVPWGGDAAADLPPIEPPPADEGDDEPTLQINLAEAESLAAEIDEPIAEVAAEDLAPEDEELASEDLVSEDLEPAEDDIEELSTSDQLALEDEPAAPPPPRRPPMPPKPPPTPPRRAKEGEVVLTQEELAQVLAGGSLDDGPDLVDNAYPESTWWADIFTEDYFRTLPKNFHKQTLREVNFIIGALGLQSGARVLDLCCGFGRHTMELAKRDYDLVGLDLAMPLLQKALNEAQRRSLSIKFVHGDMRQLSFNAVFDGIFNVQTSFGYFDDHQNFKVLQGIRKALKPGGRFFVEVINRDFVMEEIPMRIWWEGTECLILEEVDCDYSRSLLKVKRSFVFEDSSREPWEQNIQVRMYSASELRSLLRRAGFDVIELSGDYAHRGAYFGAASKHVIMVAERPFEEEE